VWCHSAFTYSAANGLRTYFNGASDGTTASTGNPANASAAPFTVSVDTNNAGRNYSGSIADATLWSAELSAAEIVALAKGARPRSIRPLGLSVWWPLDGLRSPEPDLSGNARNGVLSGSSIGSGPPFMAFTPRWREYLPPISQISVSYQRAQQILMTGP
jgi:hypothetical protein